MLAPLDNHAIFDKEVVEHHLSFKKYYPTIQEVLSSIVD